MRRAWIGILALWLLLSACSGTTAPAAPPGPEATEVPAVPATATAPPTPSPAPESTPAPSPTATPAPRWVRGEERSDYQILTKALPGSEALTVWLLGEGRKILETFGEDTLGEAMFTPESGLDRTGEEIPLALDESRYITLAADQRLKDCGLLEALLTAFEDRYGYSVEVLSAPAEQIAELAGEADLAILAAEQAEPLRWEGAFSSLWPLASTDYIREE